MGDPRLEDREPEFEDVGKPTAVRKKTVGHKAAVTFFNNQMKARFNILYANQGLLNSAVKELAKGEHEMTYEQVIDYMDYWCSRKDAEIRRKRSVASRSPFDPADWFRQSFNDGMVDTFKKERGFTGVNDNTNSALGAPSIREKMGW